MEEHSTPLETVIDTLLDLSVKKIAILKKERNGRLLNKILVRNFVRDIRNIQTLLFGDNNHHIVIKRKIYKKKRQL